MAIRLKCICGAAVFPAKVMAGGGGGTYTVRPQAFTAAGNFADAAGAVDVFAQNLAELALGPGAAVPVGTFVLVLSVADSGTPPTLRYVFDHPMYAKYLA